MHAVKWSYQIIIIKMEVNHILKLITDFLSEQNLHKTVACLIDEANMPH